MQGVIIGKFGGNSKAVGEALDNINGEVIEPKVEDKLNYLNGTKTAIKEALTDNGVEVSDNDTFRSYAEKIDKNIVYPKFGFYASSSGSNYQVGFKDTQGTSNTYQNLIRTTDKIINIGHFDFTGITTLGSCFGDSNSNSANVTVEHIIGHNDTTKNVSRFDYTFYNCTALISMEAEIDTSNVTYFGVAFYNCTNLETISELDFSKVNEITNMLTNCSKLTNLGGFKNLGKGYNASTATSRQRLDLSSSTLITHDSLMNVINDLYDIGSAGFSVRTLTLGATNLAKLTEEEIAIATNKGWNVA